jgi:beta-lactamase regulating signal transducer with metallopeptidase domain
MLDEFSFTLSGGLAIFTIIVLIWFLGSVLATIYVTLTGGQITYFSSKGLINQVEELIKIIRKKDSEE